MGLHALPKAQAQPVTTQLLQGGHRQEPTSTPMPMTSHSTQPTGMPPLHEVTGCLVSSEAPRGAQQAQVLVPCCDPAVSHSQDQAGGQRKDPQDSWPQQGGQWLPPPAPWEMERPTSGSSAATVEGASAPFKPRGQGPQRSLLSSVGGELCNIKRQRAKIIPKKE